MGKVHGSLARAGKVKSQTPKVRFFFIKNRNISLDGLTAGYGDGGTRAKEEVLGFEGSKVWGIADGILGMIYDSGERSHANTISQIG